MAALKDSKRTFQQKTWIGISNLLKEPSSQDPLSPTNFWYSENMNVRLDPYAPTLNLATVKESGNVISDFIKWMDITPGLLTTYLYGDTGNIYSRTITGSYTKLHQANSSHGNGLQYFYGDDYLYYPQDSTIGRYGPLASSPQFIDDFLTVQGGVPQNTNSLTLIASSSQYATALNSASLDIVSDITLEAYFYLNSLPSVGNSMTLLGKWDESGALRSYIMDIYAVSGFFGSGSDGALTISVNTTEAPVDSACTGTAGNYTLSATNVSFAINQIILIHQTQGTNAGQYERNVISGYSAGTITLQTPLIGTYTTGAQVRVRPQYTNVTINSGVTYTAKAWNGTTGGILSFLSNGTFTYTGNAVADGQAANGQTQGIGIGFQGGSVTGSSPGDTGEGTTGPSIVSTSANGNGGGGASGNSGAGGGGNGTAGTTGGQSGSDTPGAGGAATGTIDLTTMTFGGGGGASWQGTNGAGGGGGGIIFVTAVTITSGGGTISSNGGNGGNSAARGGGGGGAGGSILLQCQTATLGSALITATGGAGGTGGGGYPAGGAGAVGRIDINYLTSYTGTTTPTINAIQDNTLVTSATYQARLGISNDGTSLEYLTKNLTTLMTGQWNRLSIRWVASSSTATFYLNALSLGSTIGTKTVISSNASLLYMGAKHAASAVGSFLDGYIDDVRVWNVAQSSANISLYNNKELSGNEGGLKAYYKLDNAATDSTSNANNLTLVGSPLYTTSVPFLNSSTRLDIDQSYVTTGATYAVPTAINETTANQLPFTPSFDPQKSMDINVAAVGTGDWTITIHDQSNNVVASKTIINANMATGYQEFVWPSVWRIVIGKTYHAHITVTTGTSTIVTSVANVLQSASAAVADFHTYYQFLVTDTLFHPIIRWLNFLVIGNERYLAKWDGAFYTPTLIAFPQGTHVRCFGTWGIYLAIGVWQEATSSTPNVYDFPQGKIYFWDGISLTFNFSIDVPEGQVNSIFAMDSDLYYFAGYKGDLLYYKGTWANQSGSFNGTKIKRLPLLELGAYLEVYPQAMCNYQGLLYMGVGANTSSTTFPQGVYSWGALYPDYPQSLVYEHVISTGNKGSTVKLGSVYPVGKKLLASWKDGINYGVDVIDPTANTYHTQGLLQTNGQDTGELYKDHLLLKVRADHLALTAGQGVSVGYKLNREATFETSGSITNSLNKYTSLSLSNGRATEYQLQAQLTGNGTSTPTLLALSAKLDTLVAEENF